MLHVNSHLGAERGWAARVIDDEIEGVHARIETAGDRKRRKPGGELRVARLLELKK